MLPELLLAPTLPKPMLGQRLVDALVATMTRVEHGLKLTVGEAARNHVAEKAGLATTMTKYTAHSACLEVASSETNLGTALFPPP